MILKNITILSCLLLQLYKPLLHHALLPFASQSVLLPHLVEFAVSSLTPALQKHSFINALFHRTTLQFPLAMTYKFSHLQVQLHPRHLWLWKKSVSWNSIATSLLINILLLLLIPWISATTSSLVPISLTNAALHSIMKIIKCNGLNTLFLSVTPKNFFL